MVGDKVSLTYCLHATADDAKGAAFPPLTHSLTAIFFFLMTVAVNPVILPILCFTLITAQGCVG